MSREITIESISAVRSIEDTGDAFKIEFMAHSGIFRIKKTELNIDMIEKLKKSEANESKVDFNYNAELEIIVIPK